MKKLLAVIVVIFAILNNVHIKDFSLNDFFNGEITYYSNLKNTDSRDLGFCYSASDKNNQIIGESIVVKNVELNSVLNRLGAKVVKVETVGDKIIVYAKSNKIPASINLFGDKVNLQIAYTEDRCVIGWPLILGDF